MAEPEDPHQIALTRYRLYVETLRVRIPPEQFDLLMQIMRGLADSGGGTVRVRMDDEEKTLFTPELRHQLLNLMGLIGAMRPGHEDWADRVVADLGDGEFASGAMSLVPPEVAADPVQLRARLEGIDTEQRQRRSDQREVDGIARASGMDPEDDM